MNCRKITTKSGAFLYKFNVKNMVKMQIEYCFRNSVVIQFIRCDYKTRILCEYGCFPIIKKVIFGFAQIRSIRKINQNGGIKNERYCNETVT